jgi:hypothetical protein
VRDSGTHTALKLSGIFSCFYAGIFRVLTLNSEALIQVYQLQQWIVPPQPMTGACTNFLKPHRKPKDVHLLGFIQFVHVILSQEGVEDLPPNFRMYSTRRHQLGLDRWCWWHHQSFRYRIPLTRSWRLHVCHQQRWLSHWLNLIAYLLVIEWHDQPKKNERMMTIWPIRFHVFS